MSDFERRLSEALASGAEEAPDADRLAVGARTRAKSRRRARYAVVACAVVAALVVPVGVLALDGDGNGSPDGNPVATDPTEHSYGVEGWQTVEHDGVVVDVPGRWVELDTSSCEYQATRFAPQGVDPCSGDSVGLAFFGSETYDAAVGPGVVYGDLGSMLSAYVSAGEWVVSAQSERPFELRRILGSVRAEGQDAPDLRAGWRTEKYGGLAVDVPDSWQRGGLAAWCLDKQVAGWVEDPDTMVAAIACTPSSGYGLRFGRGAGDPDDSGFTERDGPEYPEGSWAGVAILPDDTGKPIGFVEVVAPTQALAEVIGGSLRVQ